MYERSVCLDQHQSLIFANTAKIPVRANIIDTCDCLEVASFRASALVCTNNFL